MLGFSSVLSKAKTLFWNQQFYVDSWTTVLSSAALGFSPMPKQGSSLAMASLNLGWDTAYTMGLMQHAVLAKNNEYYYP